MAFLFELLPLLAFVLAFKLWGIYVATAVITTAVVLQVGIRLALRMPLTILHKASAVLMLSLGGLTLALQDDRFILWKPTLFYWAMALGIGIGQLVLGKPVLEMLVGNQFKLSEERWRRLTWVWIAMLTLLGVLNLFIAYNFSRSFWVNAKLGLYGLFVLFLLAQTAWIIVRWDGIESDEELADPSKATASKDVT
jgi:intracellular septation protein